MGIPKITMAWLRSNSAVAKSMLSGAFKGPVGASYARWMAVGAGMGAIRGLADNIVGDDRVSVLGGMMQVAITGAAFRGVGHLWNSRRMFGNISSVQRTTSTGRTVGGYGRRMTQSINARRFR